MHQAKLIFRGQAGYGSKYDDETIELDLCCDCLDWFIDICMISPISEEVDLNEVLEAFQSDGSYAFDTGEATIGKGSYKATRISYTDTEGETPVEVTYYYMLDRKILVTVSSDSDHKKELAKMLASLVFDN